MSVPWSSIFSDVGVLVRLSDEMGTLSGTLSADKEAIRDAFADDDMNHVLDQPGLKTLHLSYKPMQTAVRTLRSDFADLVLRRLYEPANGLHIASRSPDEVFRELVHAMREDSQTVNASVVTLGTPTAYPQNKGTALPVISKVLDGVSSPGAGFSELRYYSGLDSELVLNERCAIRCVEGREKGHARGAEKFEINGWIDNGKWSPQGEGSGITTIYGMMKTNLSSNPFLNDYEDEIFPDNWDIVSGGANVNGSTYDLAEAYIGGKYLIYSPDEAGPEFEMTQTIPPIEMVSGKKYVLALAYRQSAGSPASGSIVCEMKGTGYTAGSGEKVTIPYTEWTTDWQVATGEFICPNLMKSDWRISVHVDSADTSNAHNIQFGMVLLGTAYWHGGFSVVIPPGSEPTVKSDAWRFDNSNSEGVVQKYFRRLGVQLPSDNTGNDELAS